VSAALGQKRVYLARFTQRKDRSRQFAKIGISGFSLLRRFAADRGTYEIELISESTYYSACDALIVEGNLHSVFSHKQLTPILQLQSNGNTECFLWTLEGRVIPLQPSRDLKICPS